jgi:hypothetical protein
MHNPFAIAVQWPDEPRRYLVHLQRPYFTAALFETASAAWLMVSWAPAQEKNGSNAIFRAASEFCRRDLAQTHVPIEFIERKNGHHLPRFVIAQTPSKELFIVEPEHSTPLVEVHESPATTTSKPVPAKFANRFDVITQWRLGEMRKYYQEFLERQQQVGSVSGTGVPCSVQKK